jgi:hypothetical protein
MLYCAYRNKNKVQMPITADIQSATFPKAQTPVQEPSPTNGSEKVAKYGEFERHFSVAQTNDL